MRGGKGLIMAAAMLGMSAGIADKAMKDLKEASDQFENKFGGKKSSRPFKNVKRIPKQKARAKNKLARAARRANRK